MSKDKVEILLDVSGGWLSVELAHREFNLEFDSSMIPGNPIEELLSSLNLVIQGIESEITWNLEPGNYYFAFSKTHLIYSLTILCTKR